MLSTTQSKYFGSRQNRFCLSISYEELQKPILISACLLQERRKGIPGVGDLGDYYRQEKNSQDLFLQ